MKTPEPSPCEEVQRWTAKRKAAVVIEILQGKTTAVELAQSEGKGGAILY